MRSLICLLLAGACAASAQPKRIVSAAPSITEALFAMGLGDRVVGVTTYCRYPAQAAKLPKIGTYLQLDIETILALRPDLVIIPKTPMHTRGALDAVKLKSMETRFDSIAEVYESITALGAAAGAQAKAALLCEQIRRGLEDVRRQVKAARPVRVMFSVGRNPGRLEGIIAAGKASYLNEVLELAGGQNIFRDSVAPYPKVSQEDILARNPEVVIDMGEHADTANVSPERLKFEESLWRQMGSIAAVKNKRVHVVASDIYVVPGPRVVEAARQMARFLHPELVK